MGQDLCPLRQCPKSPDTRRGGGEVFGGPNQRHVPRKTGVVLSRAGNGKVRACDAGMTRCFQLEGVSGRIPSGSLRLRVLAQVSGEARTPRGRLTGTKGVDLGAHSRIE